MTSRFSSDSMRCHSCRSCFRACQHTLITVCLASQPSIVPTAGQLTFFWPCLSQVANAHSLHSKTLVAGLIVRCKIQKRRSTPALHDGSATSVVRQFANLAFLSCLITAVSVLRDEGLRSTPGPLTKRQGAFGQRSLAPTMLWRWPWTRHFSCGLPCFLPVFSY